MTASNQVAEASVKYLAEAVGQAVPAGYKQTEVGVIPKDWGVVQITDVCDFIVPGRNKPALFDGRIPWITTPDFQDGGGVSSSRLGLCISREEAKKIGSRIVPTGSVIMSCVGDLGIVGITNREIVINQQLHAFIPSEKINGHFLLHVLRIKRDYFYGIATKTALPYLNKENCNSVKFPFPHLFEQTAIANALFDVDALINKLEKLIAKKQAIKTATMQQLLTGRTRLPQFALREDGTKKGYKLSELGEIPEDWEVCELQDAVDFLDGLRKPVKSGDRAKISGIYPYYGASGIVDYVNDYIFDDDLILLGEDGENILSRNLPLAFRVSGKIWVNNHAHVMKPKFNFDIGYLTDFLEGLDYSLLNSGTAQPKLNKQACLKIKVVKPTKVEQTAIATILSNMDAEIQILQQRLNKTRQIKQGMMQELLTGKTRLI